MRRLLPFLLLLGASIQAFQGSWILMKAEAAGFLLERAWRRTLAGEVEVRPWSWADSWPVGRVVFPERSGESSIVLSGASGRNLAFAPGHLDGTTPPGGDGVCVIAGHRDTHFAVLEDLEEGELVLVEDGDGGRHAFRVRSTLVVGDREWWALNPGGGVELVLLTCWPFDGLGATGARRYVIWADRCPLPGDVKTRDLR